MSISAAGSKGMKLAGIDKTQSAREDREAADVVAAWREHAKHLVAQRLGRERWYSHYELRIARVERAYSGPEGRGQG